MASVHYIDLPREFATMEIPKEYQRAFGSKALTRILTFCDHFQVNNSDYNELMKIPMQRQNGETLEFYRQRYRLQNELRRVKHLIYDYSVYFPTQKQRKAARKAAQR